MLKTFEIILDIEKEMYNVSQQAFAISQNDFDTVELDFLIMQDNAALNLTGTTIQLAIKKPSSLVVYQDVEITDAAAGEARVRLSNQAYIEFGIYTAEIYIRDAETIAVTCPFYYFSRTSIMGDESLESINDWTDFQAALFNYDKKPLILEGVPNQVPDYIGQTAFDVPDGLVFIANGGTASSWQLIGGGGDGGGVATWNTIIGKPDLFPAEAHTHEIADVNGLQTALDGKANVGETTPAPAEPVEWIDILNKPDTFTPAAHSHTFAAITDKPATYPPTAHVHAIADVTGLQTALNGKADDSDLAAKADLNHSHTAAAITDFGTAVSAAIPAEFLTQTEGDSRYAIKGTEPGTTAVAWGDIAGTLANQADLQAALNGKADDSDLAGKADINHTHAFAAITDKPATYPATAHSHPIAEVTGLQTALDGKADDGDLAAKADINHTHAFADITAKPATYPPTAHAHPIGDVTGLQAALDGKVDDAEMAGKADLNHSHTFAAITDKPATYAPTAHVHPIADVTGLQTALDGKVDDGDLAGYSPIDHTHTAAAITDFGTAVAGAIPGEYLTETEAAGIYQVKGTYLTAIPLMGGNQIGGAMVGNGLAMSTNYLFVKTLAADGTRINATNNNVAIDRTTVDTWYAAKSHSHPISEVTGLQGALDAKVDDSQIWTGTQAAYDAIATKNATTLYFVTG